MQFFGENSNKLPNGQMYTKLSNFVDNHYWQCYSELILLKQSLNVVDF